MPRPVVADAMSKIRKKDFAAFEEVRKSGFFNMMMNARDAADHAGLPLERYMAVLKNYEACMAKWPDVRK